MLDAFCPVASSVRFEMMPTFFAGVWPAYCPKSLAAARIAMSV